MRWRRSVLPMDPYPGSPSRHGTSSPCKVMSASSTGPRELHGSTCLCRVGGKFDAVAAGVVDIHRVSRPVAVHPDVLHFDALRLQLLHHGIGFPWALKVEGVVGHPWPGTVLGVEKAQTGIAQRESLHVDARHLMTPRLLRAQYISVEANHGLEVFGVDVPRA